MPKKQTITEQVVWLLLQMAIVLKEIEKIKQALQEHTVKRSCNADAFARSNDVCRTPPAKRIGGVPRTRSPRPEARRTSGEQENTRILEVSGRILRKQF